VCRGLYLAAVQCAVVCGHPKIAAEKMGSKRNVALRADSLIIIKKLTKKIENAKS
jgi:hypothetical protein